MKSFNPKYITDAKGRKVSVILPVKEYKEMLDELEDIQNVILFDKATKEKGTMIDVAVAFKQLDAKRKKNAVQSSNR